MAEKLTRQQRRRQKIKMEKAVKVAFQQHKAGKVLCKFCGGNRFTRQQLPDGRVIEEVCKKCNGWGYRDPDHSRENRKLVDEVEKALREQSNADKEESS